MSETSTPNSPKEDTGPDWPLSSILHSSGITLDSPFFKETNFSDVLNLPAWTECMGDIPLDPYLTQMHRCKSQTWLRFSRRDAKSPGGHKFNRDLSEFLERKSRGTVPSLASEMDKPSWSSEDYDVWILPNFLFCCRDQEDPLNPRASQDFPATPESITNREDFREIIDRFTAMFPCDDDVIVVHFQTMIATANLKSMIAEPTEGRGSGLCPYQMMIVLQRENLTGGETELSFNQNGNGDVLFRRALQAGEGILWSNEKIVHRHTPIEVEDPQKSNGIGRCAMIFALGGAQTFIQSPSRPIDSLSMRSLTGL